MSSAGKSREKSESGENAPDTASLAPAHARAFALAEVQCDDAQIAGALAVECGLPLADADAVVSALSERLQAARWAAQARMAEYLWSVAKGEAGRTLNGAQIQVATALAWQHLGWSREGRVDALRSALRQAERDRAKARRAGAVPLRAAPEPGKVRAG